jgi:CRISPR-associated endonuclease/helicase Cas3
MDDFRASFTKLFAGYEPFDFQLQSAEHLLAGRNVILQAPTGAGKTSAALFPFIYAWRHGLSFPRKCLYAVPMRVLAGQFRQAAVDIGAGWGEHQPKIALQTGEQQDDRTFEGDVIFTTIDQVLSSLLNVPYSLSRRRANLNAGAVLSSYLVADEVHLFPLDEGRGQGALATMVELLAEFSEVIPFLLMTATLSGEMLAMMTRQLGAVLVMPTAEDHERLSREKPRERRFHMRDEPLTAARILEEHGRRSLVVCNQVERAHQVYEELMAAKQADARYGEIEIELLHSRFLKEHRRTKEDWTRDRFKEVEAGTAQVGSSILVATQVIEVGLNITCERLHTELAPANSIIQRAGRCARFAHEQGDVVIYTPPGDRANRYLPYASERAEETWQAFAARDGQALGFADEQAIVAAVHDPADRRLLQRVADGRATRWEQIARAMHQGTTEYRPTLIRRVDSRTVIVSANPQSEVMRPFAWEGFSIFQGTLKGWFKRLQEPTGRSLPDWWLRYPVEVADADQDGRKQVQYRWEYVADAAQIDVAPLFAIHPDLVTYDPTRGLRLEPGSVERLAGQAPPRDAQRTYRAPKYNLEMYEKHIEGVLREYHERQRGLLDQFRQAATRLARALGDNVPAERLERGLALAIAFHDVGKLEVRWQRWARAYQAGIGEPIADADSMVVHTHYKPEMNPKHKEIEEQLAQLKGERRPHHAAEGAFASWPIIWTALDEDELLCPAVFTAIARHHGPQVDEFERYALHPGSIKAVATVLDRISVDASLAGRLTLAAEPESLRSRLVQPDWLAQWAIYALLVRVLRLCDGHSQEGE